MMEIMTPIQFTAAVFMLMMAGFAVITAWVMSELAFIKYAISQILAANPKIAAEVEKFTKKKEESIEVTDVEKEED